MIKLLIGFVPLLVAVWLALWVGNVGVLVMSADSKMPKTRECSYLVGVSVLKRIEALADHCPLVRSIGT